MTTEQEPRAFSLLKDAPFAYNHLDYPVNINTEDKFPYIEIPRGYDQVGALEWMLLKFRNHFVVGIFGNTDSSIAPLQTLYKQTLALNFGGFGEARKKGLDIFNFKPKPHPDSLACHLHLDDQTLVGFRRAKFLNRMLIFTPDITEDTLNVIANGLSFLKENTPGKAENSVIYIPKEQVSAKYDLLDLRDHLRVSSKVPAHRTQIYTFENAKEIFRRYLVYFRHERPEDLTLPINVAILTLQ